VRVVAWPLSISACASWCAEMKTGGVTRGAAMPVGLLVVGIAGFLSPRR
jgi:hypothetical protein